MKTKTSPVSSKHLSISDFRHKVGLPLVVVKRLIIKGEIQAIHSSEGLIRIPIQEIKKLEHYLGSPEKKAKLFFKTLGPGLITGASDDDPSGIGTYASVGAKFGFSVLWMALWLLPMMLAIQEVCARIGIVTNRGLAGVLMKHYKRKVVMAAVFLLIVANIVNIGADLGIMAASLMMLSGVPVYFGAVAFAVLIIILEIFVSYHTYVKFLKWLSLSVLAYVFVGFMIHPDWLTVFRETFTPEIQITKEYVFAMIAIFGTSITPYLFFWQASEEVEENHLHICSTRPGVVHNRVRRMRTDVGTGMVLANIVFFFIVLTTAQLFHNNGITDIASAEQAAQALLPLGEVAAYWFFAIGIIGTGLLAVPILAGASAYALAEIMKWHESLELKFSQARGFYLVIIVSILVGLLLNLFQINPINALYYSAYLNGVIALPLLVIIMVVGDDKKIMGRETHPGWVKLFGWLAVLFMIVSVSLSLLLLII